MNVCFFRCFAGVGLFVLGSVFLKSAEPLTVGGVHGGLVVRIGAAETDDIARLSWTGRYLVHVLDEKPAATEKAQKSLRRNGVYGLAFAETLADPHHLPYAENVVNAVMLQSLGGVPLSEAHRILTPGGAMCMHPRFKDPWIYGSMDPWIHRSMDPWIHGYMDTWIHGSLDS